MKAAVNALITMKSRLKISWSKTAVEPIPIIGKISTIFKILEPTIFPTTIFPLLLLRAETEAANSGKLVPMAIIVRPITASGIPRPIAKSTPPRTVNSEPTANKIKLNRINRETLVKDSSLWVFSGTSSGFSLKRFKTKRINSAMNTIESATEIVKS